MKHGKIRLRKSTLIISILLVISLIFLGIKKYNMRTYTIDELSIDVDLLTVNKYSRPAKALTKVNGIVVHYTANPNSSAKANRDYYESLASTHKTHVSSHFVIGIDGEIIQCIPTTEIAYCSNNRNYDTISIECCHKDSTGKFTKATYKSLVNLTRALMTKYNLDNDDVIRHYDVTKKKCPLYFVENPDKWESFKDDLEGWSLLDYVKY